MNVGGQTLGCFHLKGPQPHLVLRSSSLIKMANIRGIKYDFPFINFCNVPKEVFKTEGESSTCLV